MGHKPERHGKMEVLVRSRDSDINVIVRGPPRPIAAAAQRVSCSFPGTSHPHSLLNIHVAQCNLHISLSRSLLLLLPNGSPRTASRLGCSFGNTGTGPFPSKRSSKVIHSSDSMRCRYSEGLKKRVRGGLWWKRWQRSPRGNKRPRRRWASSQSSSSQRMVVKAPLRAHSSRRKLGGGAVCRSRDSDR